MIWIAIPVLIVLAGTGVLRRHAAPRRRTRPSAPCPARPSRATEARRGRDRGRGAIAAGRWRRPPCWNDARSPRSWCWSAPAPRLLPTSPPDPEQSASPVASSSTAASSACSASVWRVRRRRARLPLPVGRERLRVRCSDRNVGDLIADIEAADGFLYVPEGRMWLTEYPVGAIEKAEPCTRRPSSPAWRLVWSPSTRSAPTSAAGCPSACTSQWFECPCHGSQYNRVGEKRGGPAPGAWTASPCRSRRRSAHRRHRHHHPGSAHRHQHHRPGGRGSQLSVGESATADP